MTAKQKDYATRRAEAAQSARRAAGYCGLKHQNGKAWCTRRPHADRRHEDYYTGRHSITDTTGTVWFE
ncbi:hypothetical protein GCM10017687_44040 [Streptomyces echinatus]|uniref:Uncharacterized protein n=1 Tax=Streptomyces echinatus TaxID=67293 RepID=A0A7W9PQN7_9ACTN|nr:hypothetical protein [Streptomyces echinatus]